MDSWSKFMLRRTLSHSDRAEYALHTCSCDNSLYLSGTDGSSRAPQQQEPPKHPRNASCCRHPIQSNQCTTTMTAHGRCSRSGPAAKQGRCSRIAAGQGEREGRSTCKPRSAGAQPTRPLTLTRGPAADASQATRAMIPVPSMAWEGCSPAGFGWIKT